MVDSQFPVGFVLRDHPVQTIFMGENTVDKQTTKTPARAALPPTPSRWTFLRRAFTVEDRNEVGAQQDSKFCKE